MMKNHAVCIQSENHVAFFDNIRNIAMTCVVLYHSVTAYSNVTPQFFFHDTSPSLFADYVRWLGDVFMMPVFFFVAGYFSVSSLRTKSTWHFIKNKLKRLGIPWLLVMISIVALSLWGNNLGAYFSQKRIVGFGDSLIEMLISFAGIKISNQSDPQMHLWFITMLLLLFVAFGLIYGTRRDRNVDALEKTSTNVVSNWSIFLTLIYFGTVMSLVYLCAIQLIPKINIWAHVGILTIEPTKAPSYVGYFLLGTYAFSKKWFSEYHQIDKIMIWVCIFITSLSVFLTAGMPVLLERSIPDGYSFFQTFAFALARTFLGLSIVVLLLILGNRYWNSTSAISSTLSKNSYYIYIIHLFFVFSLQPALGSWHNGPTIVKIGMVFSMSLCLSYLISNFIVLKFPKITAVGLLILCILMVAFINPHNYEREFNQQQADFKKKATLIEQNPNTLREDAIFLYEKAMQSTEKYNEAAFEKLSIAYYNDENDYEILSYLARITIVIGDSRNLFEHMVHDVIGYTWMDSAVENDPENIKIRLNRGTDAFNKPDVFSDRWQYAEIDFKYLEEYVQNKPDASESLKEYIYASLLKISKRNGDAKSCAKYKNLIAALK